MLNQEKTATVLRNRLVQLRNLRKTLLKEKDYELIEQLRLEYNDLLDMFLFHSFLHLKKRCNLKKVN